MVVKQKKGTNLKGKHAKRDHIKIFLSTFLAMVTFGHGHFWPWSLLARDVFTGGIFTGGVFAGGVFARDVFDGKFCTGKFYLGNIIACTLKIRAVLLKMV